MDNFPKDIIIEMIAENGTYSVNELMSFKVKLLERFPASYYYKILKDGLKSGNKKYRIATQNLLMDTFQTFLTMEPPPTFEEAFAVITEKNKLSVSQLIFLKLWMLKHYRGADPFADILHDGVWSKNDDYRRETLNILANNFDSCLKEQPLIKDVVKLIVNGRRHIDNERIIEKAFTYLKDVPEKAWQKYLFENPIWDILFSLIKIKGHGIILKDRLTSHMLYKYKEWLTSNPPLGKVIIFTAPNGFYPSEFIIQLKEITLRHYNSHQDFLKIFSDCENTNNERYFKRCQKLAASYAHDYVKTKPKSIDVVVRIRQLSALPKSSILAKEEYQEYLLKIAQKHFQKTKDTKPTQSISPASDTEQAKEASACSICLEDNSNESIHSLEGCHESVCRRCLKEFIQHKIKEQTFPVPCINSTCKIPLTEADL